MPATFASNTLCTRARVVQDGRSVTLRHAVPSDAPRILTAFGPAREVAWGFDLIALDDHCGDAVGHAASPSDVAVVRGWDGCRLAGLLAFESKEA